MPRMDGLELCTILAGERHAMKMLMMSGDLRGKERASEKRNTIPTEAVHPRSVT